MKKVLLILACGIAAQLSYAQATPKWAGKAKKAVFSIVTYDKDNKIKNTGNGFYINENGTALSDYTLFEGAERAVIINADSKELPVLRILGANSMYDIVKFNTETDKKTIALKSASQPASVGETVYLLPYSTQKAATCPDRDRHQSRHHRRQGILLYTGNDNQRKNSKLPYYECQWRSIRFNPKKRIG